MQLLYNQIMQLIIVYSRVILHMNYILITSITCSISRSTLQRRNNSDGTKVYSNSSVSNTLVFNAATPTLQLLYFNGTVFSALWFTLQFCSMFQQYTASSNTQIQTHSSNTAITTYIIIQHKRYISVTLHAAYIQLSMQHIYQ